jgi:hypothetical protein
VALAEYVMKIRPLRFMTETPSFTLQPTHSPSYSGVDSRIRGPVRGAGLAYRTAYGAQAAESAEAPEAACSAGVSDSAAWAAPGIPTASAPLRRSLRVGESLRVMREGPFLPLSDHVVSWLQLMIFVGRVVLIVTRDTL